MTHPLHTGIVRDGTKRGRACPRVSKLNRTEERYRDLLEQRKRAGEIQEYFVQAVTLVLARDCRYTADFLVIENDGTLVFHEVKGFMHAVGAAKFRVAQSMFWWAKFVMVRREKGQWTYSDDAQRNKRRGE